MKKFNVIVNGKSYDVSVEEINTTVEVKTVHSEPSSQEGIKSPMPGVVRKVCAKIGDSVKKGQTLLILESMKMENEIVAARNGSVQKMMVSEGSEVDTDDVLCVVG